MSAAREVPERLSARALPSFLFPRYYFYKFKSSRSGIKAIFVVGVKWNLAVCVLSLSHSVNAECFSNSVCQFNNVGGSSSLSKALLDT